MARERIESSLLEFQIKSTQSGWIQNLECSAYSVYNRVMNMTSITIAAITATSSLVLKTSGTGDTPLGNAINISNIALLYLAAITTSLQHFLDYEKKAEVHRTASLRFNNLSNNIKRTLTLSSDNVSILEEYYKWASSEYDSITGSCPDVSASSLRKFKELFGVELKTMNIKGESIDLTEQLTTFSVNDSIKLSTERFLVNSYNKETL